MSIERQVAELAIRLMEVESTSGHEAAVITVAEQLLADRRWNTERIPVGDGRDAILATSAPDPLVTLSTHLDTVPPYMPPRLDGDTLHGRGACDAKGIAASMILAADRLRDRDVPVALLLVVGEETTHDGAHAANARPTTSRILINGEPTESTLAVGTKGAMRAFVRTQGRAAHSAYPELGHSATRDLVNLLATLDAVEWPSDPVLGATTVNIGMLSGGVADNVMAPSAEARLMLRLVTPVEEVWPILERWAAGRAAVERGVTVPPVRLGTLDGFPTSVAAFATDIPALTNWGTPYLFGPGSIHVAHTAHEHVSIKELAEAVSAYERIAIGALEREGLGR
ncbi:MAG TPA: M20/M25/M40 family metallo-hydrolase [Gemmatimonadaceae bacterium]|jgi:acetylornithine deacetylase|nr:M20/M25/M40 family metallo-hydrolase [Gemmatimonadota bacterium]MBK7834705.1 M20/M25/M40 family metallo-hydrolase [Gemmatimonadota bacterium]MBP9105428.1 M20/M25/M40 family metallo-hydrolase [Gemmatimonadaceae bacterium]HNV75454.1 M20/M25/M40 family metallo-hydrolase [Gemmatimonadaceae bacterium]